MYECARQATEELCVSIVRVDGGVIGSVDFIRMRCTNAQGGRGMGYVCVGQEGRARVAGLSLPLCPLVPPLSPPCIHPYIRVREVCELLMVEKWLVLYAEGAL